jgi:hypothetical protein
MEFKINIRKRIRILKDVLLKIWREHSNPEHEWFSTFIRDFSAECGLQKTSVIGKNSYFSKRRKKETYLFKIVDKQKFFLAKIKYGI